MHTTQTTYHRIFFSNITNRALLNDLASVLGMETTENMDVFDLIQSEGESTIVCDALSDTFPERLIPVGCQDAYDMPFDDVVIALKKLAEDEDVSLISRLFEVSRYQTGANDTDLDCDELFDLLSVLGNTHFTVDGIYTQWAMSSDKNRFGAHAGGAQVTTQYFCVPCIVTPDRAETVIKTLAKHTPEQMGDYFVHEFINPIMDGICNDTLRNSTEAGFVRSWYGVGRFGSDSGNAPLSEIDRRQGIEDLGNAVIANMQCESVTYGGALMEQTGKDWTRDLEYFRNWRGNMLSRTPESVQFYSEWFGLNYLDCTLESGRLPIDFEDIVKDIRTRLAAGEELIIPQRENK